jgi:uncharacterized membrane protein (TIGR02234 family)
MRRARSTSVLATLVAGAAGVIASTQTWVHLALTGGATSDVAVPGATIVPVLAPLSLAVLALGAALSIVGRVLRLVFGALTVLIAVVLGTLVAPLLFGVPASAVAPSITEVTGIAGDAAVGDLIASMSTTVWPFVAALAVAVLAATGVFVTVTGARWPTGGRKYEAAARRAARRTSDGPLDAVDSWDDLSRGDDPTTPQTPR